MINHIFLEMLVYVNRGLTCTPKLMSAKDISFMFSVIQNLVNKCFLTDLFLTLKRQEIHNTSNATTVKVRVSYPKPIGHRSRTCRKYFHVASMHAF